jgi:hypothetical protein
MFGQEDLRGVQVGECAVDRAATQPEPDSGPRLARRVVGGFEQPVIRLAASGSTTR